MFSFKIKVSFFHSIKEGAINQKQSIKHNMSRAYSILFISNPLNWNQKTPKYEISFSSNFTPRPTPYLFCIVIPFYSIFTPRHTPYLFCIDISFSYIFIPRHTPYLFYISNSGSAL